MRPVEPLIWLALTDTCMAATRTSAMMAAISATMRLMASTTLPRTSEVTSPRLVRSPWETSMAVSRNLMMFSCSSSRRRRSSSRSDSVCTCERSRTMASLKAWPAITRRPSPVSTTSD